MEEPETQLFTLSQSADSLGGFVEVTVRGKGGASKRMDFNGSNTLSDGGKERKSDGGVSCSTYIP